MYPLEAIYGPRSYRTFKNSPHLSDDLRGTRQSAKEVAEEAPLYAQNYAELLEIISFLSVMNKRHSLYFRGQVDDRPPKAALFRDTWASLSGKRHEINARPGVRQKVWQHLLEHIPFLVQDVCGRFPTPRPATLSLFREAVWAVAQHYYLWPTPLIDVSPNLRVAASFALSKRQASGFVYVYALPASTNSVTFDADQHVVLARLQAVCPPVAKRPHYQDGYLIGRFPFDGPTGDGERAPRAVSDPARRLVAKILLRNSPRGSFWDRDFPQMGEPSLVPSRHDALERAFRERVGEIDASMAKICAS
ncbi:MAG: FRG domain-containing protein [Proteobacteria bacterium]|nr:FRG domain-containing protein [Pseudomonadota bacterium]